MPDEATAILRTGCRACGGSIATVFADLGSMPPANSYLRSPAERASERSFPLCARVCHDCLLVQTDVDVPPQELFADYAYFSSYSTSWLAHARSFADMAVPRFALGPSSFVVEIASNDGYLLRNFVERDIRCLGVDPSKTVAAAAVAAGVPTEAVFFSVATAERLVREHGRADLMIANNVLAHVPDINDFIGGFARLLAPDGHISFEFPHLLELIRHVEFDTIYHEHFSYLSLIAVERVLERHDLVAVDVQRLQTHGGSLRLICRHAPAAASAALESLRAEEAQAGLNELCRYEAFNARIKTMRRSFCGFLAEQRARGRRVAGYGAAAKGNTLLNFCGIGVAEIAFVADRNPHKQGTLLPGSHIPVTDPNEIRHARPDFIVILPWNLKEEIAEQLAFVREWGAQFVVAIPEVRVF